jgi:hypothetical protein
LRLPIAASQWAQPADAGGLFGEKHMRALTKLRLRLRSLFRRDDLDAQLERELQFHLEQQIQETWPLA